jgi:hypothetical protein
MEHRCGLRAETEFEVEVRLRRHRYFPAQARNVCASGMFLDLQGATIPPYTLTELHFSIGDVPFNLEAMVVHQQPGGIGVMFRDPRPEVYQAASTSERPGLGDAIGAPALGSASAK